MLFCSRNGRFPFWVGALGHLTSGVALETGELRDQFAEARLARGHAGMSGDEGVDASAVPIQARRNRCGVDKVRLHEHVTKQGSGRSVQ